MNVVDFTAINPDMHSIQLHVDAQRPRDFAEHIRFGVEYTFMMLSLYVEALSSWV